MTIEAAKTAFENDLDSRIARAKENLQQAHTDLFQTGDADVTPVPVETGNAPLETPGTPAEPAPAGDAMPAAPAPEDIVQEPPAEPAEPAAAAPKEPKEPEEGERRVNWKQARDQMRADKRELKRLQKELETLKAGKAAAPAQEPGQEQTPAAVQPEEDDPFGFKAELNKVRGEIAQMRQRTETERESDRLTNELVQAETTYRSSQPHGSQYDEAVKYMVDVERERYKLSGMANSQGALLLKAANDFGDTDPRAAAVRKAIEDTADANDLSDDEAAAVVATDLWIAAQRNGIINGHRGNMAALPNAVWNMALRMGFQPKAIAAAAAAVPGTSAAPAQSPAEKLRATARASAAGKSLSNLSSSGMPLSDGPAIRTVQDFQTLFQKDPAAARKYMMDMMKVDPQWHSKLAAK